MILKVLGNRWLVTILTVSLNIRIYQCQASPQVETPLAFMQQALDLANSLRAKHQSGPLQLNMTLSADSELWAKKIGAQCDKVGKATAYYSRTPDVGENVWVTDSQPDVDGTIPIMAWYNQVQKYNWSNNIFSYDTAQFTTLVWKGATQFGIAKYKTPVKGYVMVVARFLPNTNINYYSSFAANVFPPLNNATSITTTPAPTTTPKPAQTPTVQGPLSTGSAQGAVGASPTLGQGGSALTTSAPAQTGTPDQEEIVFIPEQINQSVNG